MAKLELVYTATDGKVYKSALFDEEERPAIEVGDIQSNLNSFTEKICDNGLSEDDYYRICGSYEDYE